MTPEERDARFYRDTETIAFPCLDDHQLDLLTKLGGPVPRRVQARATRQYLQGLRDSVAS